MIFKRNIIYSIISLGCFIVLLSCVKSREFDSSEIGCSDAEFTMISIAELKGLYQGETVQIHKDLVVQGYVTSSDKKGNFFNVIHFQDEAISPIDGMQIELELRDSHLFYDIGQPIRIKLKGLYLGQSNSVFKIGGVFTSFGNRSVGRLPYSVVFDHVLSSCTVNKGIQPTIVTIAELNDRMLGTLISFENIEIREDEIGLSFAVAEEETKRALIDCNDNELILLNSGYSDFQNEILPDKMGTATGILVKDKGEYQLVIRTMADLDFNKERCANVIDEFTSNTILISEIADPNNNAGARFVELYNSSSESLSLKGWSLERYTNASLEVSSTIDLSDYIIEQNSVLTISPNTVEFESVYGFLPTVSVGTNSPADSNGDDNIALVDPFGTIIDIFGVIGEDGSGTNHEFEDGKAVRKLETTIANSSFTANEWIIYNDTGGAGTINIPQNAPMDFSPGSR
tara:strand:- start:15421 stop:16791 length:1371 start_codon:yes stop_codon:yes gene_type:complete